VVSLCARHGVPIRHATRDLVEANVRSLRSRGGGYGSPEPDLLGTAYAVATLRILGLPTDGDASRQFLRRCEDPEQGFRLVPDSSAGSLEVTLAGLRCSARLGVAPSRSLVAARRFALACRTANGGFGRVPGAIATLDDTRFALEILLDGSPGIGLP